MISKMLGVQIVTWEVPIAWPKNDLFDGPYTFLFLRNN